MVREFRGRGNTRGLCATFRGEMKSRGMLLVAKSTPERSGPREFAVCPWPLAWNVPLLARDQSSQVCFLAPPRLDLSVSLESRKNARESMFAWSRLPVSCLAAWTPPSRGIHKEKRDKSVLRLFSACLQAFYAAAVW